MEKNLSCIGKYEFVEKNVKWPEWASFLVGVGNGYHAFELEGDYEEFLKNYREEHKDDRLSSYEYSSPDEDNSLPRTGRIGFAA